MSINTAILTSIVMPVVMISGSFTSLAEPANKANAAITESVITTTIKTEKINRAKILREFFKKNHSPLIGNVDKFVEVADKYNLDYRLLPAISCTESSCGKLLIKNSFNPFGWGIYGTTVTTFKSYDEAIEKVGLGLSKGYVSKGLDTPEEIAPIYTPPSYRHWMGATRFFMNQMDDIASASL